jgi:hypothetical protein
MRKELKTVETTIVLEGTFKIRGILGQPLVYQVTLKNTEGVETFDITYISEVVGYKHDVLKEAIKEKLEDDIKSTRFFYLDI